MTRHKRFALALVLIASASLLAYALLTSTNHQITS